MFRYLESCVAGLEMFRILHRFQHDFPRAYPRHFSALLRTGLFVFCISVCLRAETISGTIHDPSGAVIVGAKIEITGGELAEAIVVSSDGEGKFTSPDLKAGTYSLRVTRETFEPLVKTVEIRGAAVEVDLKLSIAQQQVKVNVAANDLKYANSDPVYRQLRGLGVGQTFRFDNFTVQFDVGTFHFETGTLTILSPVNGIVTGMIFAGEGHFSSSPSTALDAQELKRRAGTEEFDEEFTEVVFRFTAEPHLKFLRGMGDRVEGDAGAGALFDHWKDRMRKRREIPLGFTEDLLHGETMDNADADLLAAIYNPKHPQFMNAYIQGKKHKDLRFFVRARVGAVPQLDSPEEVALINYDPEGMEDGVWYLAHLESEYQHHVASSEEDRRLFATHSYKIETIISKNQHLFSTATLTFQALIAGERVLKFGLLPNLRVSRVIDQEGQDLHYIQESRKEDGSFYVVLSDRLNSAKSTRSQSNTPVTRFWSRREKVASTFVPGVRGIPTSMDLGSGRSTISPTKFHANIKSSASGNSRGNP